MERTAPRVALAITGVQSRGLGLGRQCTALPAAPAVLPGVPRQPSRSTLFGEVIPRRPAVQSVLGERLSGKGPLAAAGRAGGRADEPGLQRAANQRTACESAGQPAAAGCPARRARDASRRHPRPSASATWPGARRPRQGCTGSLIVDHVSRQCNRHCPDSHCSRRIASNLAVGVLLLLGACCVVHIQVELVSAASAAGGRRGLNEGAGAVAGPPPPPPSLQVSS